MAEAKREAATAVERCSRVQTKLEDLCARYEVREDRLNKVIKDLETKVREYMDNNLELLQTTSQLCKGEDVHWELTTEAADFAMSATSSSL